MRKSRYGQARGTFHLELFRSCFCQRLPSQTRASESAPHPPPHPPEQHWLKQDHFWIRFNIGRQNPHLLVHESYHWRSTLATPQKQECRSWWCQHRDEWQIRVCVSGGGGWASLQLLGISVFSLKTCVCQEFHSSLRRQPYISHK